MFISEAPTCGLSVFSGSFQSFSVLARCGLMLTSMSEGRRWQNAPTSRAEPQADGWPVSENAPLPGRACLPSSRWFV